MCTIRLISHSGADVPNVFCNAYFIHEHIFIYHKLINPQGGLEIPNSCIARVPGGLAPSLRNNKIIKPLLGQEKNSVCFL